MATRRWMGVDATRGVRASALTGVDSESGEGEDAAARAAARAKRNAARGREAPPAMMPAGFDDGGIGAFGEDEERDEAKDDGGGGGARVDRGDDAAIA